MTTLRNKTLGSIIVALAAALVLTAAQPAAAQPVLEWSQPYGGLGVANGMSIAVDASGIYVAGNTATAAGGWADLILFKRDFAGNLLWDRTWPNAGGNGHDGAADLALSASAVYVAGSTDEHASWLRSAVTLKFSKEGVLNLTNSPAGWWTRFSGDTSYHGYNYAFGIAVDEFEKIYIVGASERAYNNMWTYLTKDDSAGAEQWHQHHGVFGVGGNFSEKLALSGGNLYTAGHTGRGVNEQMLILKYVNDGTPVWTYTWGGATSDRGKDVALSGADVFITGHLGGDLALLKLHDDGASATFVGSTTFSAVGNSIGHGITVLENRIYVVGSADVGGHSDALLLAYDTDLNLLWDHSWGGAGDDLAQDVSLHNGILYVTGTLDGQAFVNAYRESCSLQADINGDGVVNLADLGILLSEFGMTCP